jgi:hypothetical protein
MDEQNPAEPAKATAQAQMDDHNPTDASTNTDQTSTDSANAIAEAQVDDLLHAFGKQMTLTSVNPVKTTSVQSVQVLHGKASQDSTVAPRFRNAATRVEYITHILGSGFPNELMSSVLEIAIRSARLRWHPTGSESLNAVVDDFFVWPSALDKGSRESIQIEAGIALLKEAIIKLPAEFTLTNGAPVLVIPPVLLGNEEHIRRLVLDVKRNTRDNGYQTQLNRAGRGIDALFSRLPNLETFVVSLHIGTNRPQNEGSFHANVLALRNQTSYTTIEDLKTSLLKFIDILYAKRPRIRKFVRFIDYRSIEYLHFGPLVRVPKFVGPQAQDGTSEATGDPTIGSRVLEQAYRYHRDGHRFPSEREVHVAVLAVPR